MIVGQNIFKLRKKHNLSQEELAEKVGVTRQTISKWELGETTPDINQAKKLSQIFNISLDELTNNDVKSVLVEKVSNTEKSTNITMKILKIIGISFLLLIIFNIMLFLLFISQRTTNRKIIGTYSINCHLGNDNYNYEFRFNKNYQIIEAGGDGWIANHIDIEKYDDANQAIAHIEDYFKDHNGKCIINQNNI